MEDEIIECIAHGAEAKVSLKTMGEKKVIIKERVPKKYRHPQLDKKLN